MTDDIPGAPVTRPTGSFTFDSASGAPGAGAARDVTIGNGKVALHLAGSGRRSTEVKTPEDEIANSFVRAGTAEVGASYTTDEGFFGASYGWDRTHYGVPFIEEGQTSLDPRRHNVTVRGERRGMASPTPSTGTTSTSSKI